MRNLKCKEGIIVFDLSLSLEKQIRNCLDQQYRLFGSTIEAKHSGMNNISRVIHCDGETYQLRIYENHQDRSKVEFEHSVLTSLAKIEIYVPIPLKMVSGSTIGTLQDQRLVSIFHYIAGEQKTGEHILISLVEAAAKLNKQMATLQETESGVYSPYYELEQNYPHFTNEKVYERFIEHEMSKHTITMYKTLKQERERLEQLKPILSRLPHQLIHGDLNFSNCVVQHNKVIGILDFEFVTVDLRAMELAILLTEVYKNSESYSEQLVEKLICIYNQIHPLTEQEIRALPDLIKLRAVDVAFHFLTRYIEGRDTPHTLHKILRDCERIVSKL